MAALVWTSAAQAQGQWQGRQVAGMAVQVYTPAAGQPGQRPLLIALHGCAQSAQAMQQRAGLERAAEIHAAIVATPSVPNGGVILGCWDYYGANHSRRTRHVAPLLALVDALLADEALGIAPERVWIAGLSSGGGQAAVMGCVAPDVFAGVGVAAGPAVGTPPIRARRPTRRPWQTRPRTRGRPRWTKARGPIRRPARRTSRATS